MSVNDRKNIITERIIEIERALNRDLLLLRRQINELQAELVSVDTSDIRDLITYGYDCFNLSMVEKDSLRAKFLREKSIEVANEVQRKAKTPEHLIDAGKIYSFNGIFKSDYYDSANAIYNRIIFLIENNSINIPQSAENDRVRYLSDLKEAVQDLLLYSEMSKRFQLRKYFRQ